MDHRLNTLIDDYIAAVNIAVSLLKDSGIELPASNTEWACSEVPQRGVIGNDVPYFKHGYGCAVRLPSGSVDFDFGENGETDGFDLWRLTCFIGERLGYYGFRDDAELKDVFEASVKSGELL